MLLNMLFAIGLFVMLFFLLIAGFAVFIIIFWIAMLIDCLQRKKFEDKLAWVLVLIFLNVLGSVLYYFLVRRKGKKR